MAARGSTPAGCVKNEEPAFRVAGEVDSFRMGDTSQGKSPCPQTGPLPPEP